MSVLNAINIRMSRVKRALGLPQTVNVLGVMQICPILVVFSLLILGALLVVALG
jgi:hypothetical protein